MTADPPARFDERLSESRFTARLAAGLGLAALALATIGVFGVFAFIVRQQTREIGIRIALGARPMQVIRGVIAFSGRPLAAGLLIGFTGAVGAANLLRSNLFGLSPVDVRTYLAAGGVLALAALAAIVVPARRTARVDPVRALRCE